LPDLLATIELNTKIIVLYLKKYSFYSFQLSGEANLQIDALDKILQPFYGFYTQKTMKQKAKSVSRNNLLKNL